MESTSPFMILSIWQFQWTKAWPQLTQISSRPGTQLSFWGINIRKSHKLRLQLCSLGGMLLAGGWNKQASTLDIFSSFNFTTACRMTSFFCERDSSWFCQQIIIMDRVWTIHRECHTDVSIPSWIALLLLYLFYEFMCDQSLRTLRIFWRMRNGLLVIVVTL